MSNTEGADLSSCNLAVSLSVFLASFRHRTVYIRRRSAWNA